MKSSRNKFQCGAIIIILALALSGCTSPYLLTRHKATMELEPNEGVVFFSSKFEKKEKPDQKNIFWVTSLILQEVNQYKSYGEKKIYMIPSSSRNYIKQDDLFLYPLKLPRGTYKITSFGGLFRSLFAEETFVSINRLFDIVPGEIKYAGRLEIIFPMSVGQQLHETKIEDKFEDDQGRFKVDYPALQNKNIVKDLIY